MNINTFVYKDGRFSMIYIHLLLTVCVDAYGTCAKTSFDIMRRAAKSFSIDDLGVAAIEQICRSVIVFKLSLSCL